jgi:N-formylglutamate deformylase
MSPVVLHIPHASMSIPEDVRSTFLLDDAVIERELLVMTDHFTDEIVAGFAGRSTA